MSKKVKFAVMFCLIVCASVVQADVLTFQNGVNGYEGTKDTYIKGDSETNKLNNYGADANYISICGEPWDAPGSGFIRSGLLGFKDVVGNGPNQVPAGATINSVTLAVRGAGAPTIRAYSMLTNWEEGNSLNAPEQGAACYSYRAYQADGIYEVGEAWGTSTVATNGPVGGGADYGTFLWSYAFGGTANVQTFDLTSYYAADLSQIEYGMLLVSASSWTTAWLNDSETATIANRPLLTVDYTVPEPATMSLFGMAALAFFRRRK